MNLEANDQMVDRALRQGGAMEANLAAFQGTRAAASVVTGSFTIGTRANRVTAVDVATGDEWFETDTKLLFYYSSAAWHYETGIYVATDAQRAALSISTTDNGALAFASDTLVLWQVTAGAWVKLLQVQGTADQITATIAAGVLTLSLVASPNVTTSYKVNGTKVLGARQTGWGVASGTPSRTAYAAYSGQTISDPPLVDEVQRLDDKVKTLSETMVALITDLTTHGAIGA